MTPAPTGRRAIEVPESATLREAVGGRAEGRGAGAADEAASGRDDGRGGGEAVAESSSRPLQPAPSTAPAPSGEAAGDGHDADSTPPSGLHQALGTGGSGAFDPATGSPDADGTPRATVVFGGRYLLEERIATGGMAAVWRAHDEVLARTVAVKVLHGHLAADAAFRERFRREAISAAKLTHPAVVSVYDTGTDGAAVYLVMEFVDGVTLKDVIADNGTLTPGEAATVGEKVARGLAYAHDRGLVHRDVKPANILIGHDGSVKVADFGIAKAEEAGDDLTKTGMVLGTAAYVAPEQITAQPIDGRADQYALGCVLYEALAGRQPFKGDNAVATAAQRLERAPLPLRQIRADVPRGLSTVLDRALAREPADRFPTAAALADALMPFADADAERTAALTTPLVFTSAASAPVAREEAGEAVDDPSFLRSEGRWLAPVLALLVLAGALVGVGLATGVLEGSDGMPFNFARRSDVAATQDPTAPAEVTALVPAGLEDFDPLGDGRENPDQLPALVDGDPDTAWETEGYDTPALGGLKSGVGFILPLAGPARLDRITLTTTMPGISYELRLPAAPGAPGESGEPGAANAAEAEALQGWRVAARVEDAPAVATTELSGFETDRVLVWITGDLQPDGGRFRAGFSGVEIQGVDLVGQ